MAEMTHTEIAAELQKMIQVNADDPSIFQRVFKSSLCIMYEFKEDDQIYPYFSRIESASAAHLEAGTIDYDACDVVIRITPEALHQILQGELGGREAMVGGLLDIRKAPSMSKLLMLRSLFSRYRKWRQRMEVEMVDDDMSTCVVVDKVAEGS